MSTIVKPIPHTVDLNEPVKKTYIDTLLATEDNLAHRFDITLNQGGQAVAMPSGAAVTAYFIRYSDNATVPITGGAVNGNVATVTLTKACYNKPGQFALIIKVSGGGIVNTVFYGEGTVYTSSTDKVVNDENIVPTLADLLAQIAAMEAGTAAANTATNRANAAANRCEQMQIDASGMAGDSNKLGGKAPEYYIQTRNLLDNSDFEVAQAGHMGTHGNGVYLADRWHVIYNPTCLTAVKGKEGITLTSSGAGFVEIRQPLSDEAINAIDGKPATLAVCYSDKISVVNFTWNSTSDGYDSGLTSNNTGWYVSIFRNNASERVRCRIYSSTAATATIKWVALYEGTYTAETLPPYVPKGYANELLACEVAEDGKAPWKNIIWEAPSRTFTLAPDSPLHFDIENCADPTKLTPFLVLDQTNASPITVTNYWASGTTLSVRLKYLGNTTLNNVSVKLYCINLGAF